jgi:hypothetical protein
VWTINVLTPCASATASVSRIFASVLYARARLYS